MKKIGKSCDLLAVISKVLRLPTLQPFIHAAEVLYTCHAPSGWALPGFERNHYVRSLEQRLDFGVL